MLELPKGNSKILCTHDKIRAYAPLGTGELKVQVI
jgi:hypothetical protein